MNAITIPAFDPDSPDEEILTAFEEVRAYRVQVFSFDDRADSDELIASLGKTDDDVIADEDRVYKNVATTLPGVVARLMLLIPCLDCDRWIDRGLMEQGFGALYRNVESLSGNAQQVAHAARELLDIEWLQALAAYEKSRDDFDLAIKLKSLAEAEKFRLGAKPVPPFLQSLLDLGDQLEDRFTSAVAEQLMRTLAPYAEAYERKMQIAMAEGLQEEAMPWLARDAKYLMGRIEEARHG